MISFGIHRLNKCTISSLFKTLCDEFYNPHTKTHLELIYHGIYKDYINNKSLAYNIIIIPSLESLYQTKFKHYLNLKNNLSGNYKEIRDFCKEKKILLIVIDTTYAIMSQDENKKKLFKVLNIEFQCYKRFINILNELETKTNYKFNVLKWIDDLNNENCINEFCGLSSWDTSIKTHM